jgi:hypothetical protein
MGPTPTSTISDYPAPQPAPTQPAVFGFGSSEGSAPLRSAPPIELSGRRAAPIKVVMQLPDLSIPIKAAPGRREQIKNLAFWISIALGAMLALYLIVGGSKRAEAPSDEAPAWTAPSAPHIEAPAASPQATDAPQSGAAQPAPSWPNAPGQTSIPSAEAPAVQDGAAVAPGPDATNGAPGIRTAQRSDTRWDGTAPRAHPGQASPLGISTSVQP